MKFIKLYLGAVAMAWMLPAISHAECTATITATLSGVSRTVTYSSVYTNSGLAACQNSGVGGAAYLAGAQLINLLASKTVNQSYSMGISGSLSLNGVKYNVGGSIVMSTFVYPEYNYAESYISSWAPTYTLAATAPVASNPYSCAAKFPQYPQYWAILRQYGLCQ